MTNSSDKSVMERFNEKFKYLYGEKFAYDNDFPKVKSFLQTELQRAREQERGIIREMLLDVIEKTNWIEEPKSAFGQINKILKAII